jgi:hypothetical protein
MMLWYSLNPNGCNGSFFGGSSGLTVLTIPFAIA